MKEREKQKRVIQRTTRLDPHATINPNLPAKHESKSVPFGLSFHSSGFQKKRAPPRRIRHGYEHIPLACGNVNTLSRVTDAKRNAWYPRESYGDEEREETLTKK